METNPTQMSLNWFEIWRTAFLRPTINTFSRIISDQKASIKWGIIWMAITAFIAWFVGPQKPLVINMVYATFGPLSSSYYLFYSLIGALIATIFAVIVLLINTAIAHGFARLFKGAGTFHQLVYCWGVMQLPFILLSGLVINVIPSLYVSSREFTFSTIGLIIQVTIMLITIGLVLYLSYAEVVAFSAVERFSIGKGFGVLILLAIIIGIASACLSYGFQSVLQRSLRY